MATDFPASPSNGDTHAGFTYNSTTGTWETSVSTSSIDLLADVDTATAAPSTGQLLQWNGSNWVPYTHTNGITEIDQWRLSDNITADADPISSNLERVDDAVFSKLGTGMSVSSGAWTFPSTGLYEITVFLQAYLSVQDAALAINTDATINGGTDWDRVAQAATGRTSATGNVFDEGSSQFIFNVTNTTNVKIKFIATSIVSPNYIRGGTDWNRTSFTFKRLGDSQ